MGIDLELEFIGRMIYRYIYMWLEEEEEEEEDVMNPPLNQPTKPNSS